MGTIIEFFEGIDPVWGALIATMFTWGVTALGAAVVFFFKTLSRKWLDAMLGFTGGVMVAASFWSLLAPSIEMSARMGMIEWLLPAIGFAMGALFLFVHLDGIHHADHGSGQFIQLSHVGDDMLDLRKLTALHFVVFTRQLSDRPDDRPREQP